MLLIFIIIFVILASLLSIYKILNDTLIPYFYSNNEFVNFYSKKGYEWENLFSVKVENLHEIVQIMEKQPTVDDVESSINISNNGKLNKL